jgi:hypothetical protein
MVNMSPQKIHGRETKAIEDLVDLKYPIGFENTGHKNVGALLIERNGRLMLRFCFGLAGINTEQNYICAGLFPLRLMDSPLNIDIRSI